MNDSQRRSLHVLANSTEGIAETLDVLAGFCVELQIAFNDDLAEQSPDVIRLISSIDKLKDSLIATTHRMKATAAIASDTAEGERV